MRNSYLTLASFGIVLLASGCGGGGGGAPTSNSGSTAIPTAAVQITPSNAEKVAQGSAGASNSATDSGSSNAQAVGVVAQPSAHPRSAKDVGLGAFAQFNSRRPATVTGAAQSNSIACQTGTMDVTANFADPNAPSNGDSISITFNNCDDGNGTQNGSMSMTIVSMNAPFGSQGTATNPVQATFDAKYGNYSNVTAAGTQTMNGDVRFSTNDDGTTISGSMSGAAFDMTDSVNGGMQLSKYMLKFSDTYNSADANYGAFSESYNLTTASLVASGTVTLAQTTPFTGNYMTGNGYPTAGEVLVTGDKNSTMNVIAQPDGVHVQLVVDEDGPGPIAPTTITTTWAKIFG